MMSDNKYYTPEIEEFHFGFEYVEKRDDELLSMFVDSGDYIQFLKEGISNGAIRVKHLDREDIESLGFEHENWVLPSNETHWFVLRDSENKHNDFKAIWVGTEYHYRKKQVMIFKGRNPKDMFKGGKGRMLFKGTIKNKSELKKILKQIGV